MTTENLEGIDELIADQSARADQWRQRAADLLAARTQLDEDNAKAQANAQMVLRAITQHYADKAVPLDHEIEQVAGIVNGPAVLPAPPASVIEPVAPAPAPEPEPVPPVPAVEPAPPAPATPPAATTQVNVFVATRQWIGNFTVLQWFLALVGALIGFYLGVAHHGFNHTVPGIGKALVAIVWTVGLTDLGFGLGGFIGGLFNRNRVLAEA